MSHVKREGIELMADEHFDALTQLRDRLVVERRNLVQDLLSDSFADTETRHETIGHFMGLQQFIDTVERALGHEVSLTQNRGPAPGQTQFRPFS
ncbi:hypothetical protein DYH55_18140 [Methylovirgula sp. 4M-Z18]|nr:hypothetical protein DYH55_18140 [Methylovirgula sp. 4M-Z18]